MMANSFHAFINLEDYMGWIELFGLEEEEPIFQKRVLSIVSGAILPVVALGFIKSLVDYIRPEQPESPQPIVAQPAQPAPPVQPLPTEVPDMREPLGEWANEELEIEGYDNALVDEEDNPPIVDEKLTDEDNYSRDAKKAKTPAEVGEVVIAPETVEVKTENAGVIEPEKPASEEHITPVGDPIVIPTEPSPVVTNKTKAKNNEARGFVRPAGEPKP